jgi:membrane protein implicated in regulation of membrane protease activity
MAEDYPNQQRTRWASRTVMTYALLQLPGLALVVLLLLLLRHWMTISPWVFWGIIVAWMAKDAVLFPFVWRSYDPDLQEPAEALIGEIGVTRQRLDPTGYIRVCGVLWRAEVADGGPSIEPGKTVRVKRRHGLTLIVVLEEETANTQPRGERYYS